MLSPHPVITPVLMAPGFDAVHVSWLLCLAKSGLLIWQRVTKSSQHLVETSALALNFKSSCPLKSS